MVVALTFVIIGIVGYAAVREGLLTALTGLINVLAAGLLTFACFEPLADQLESVLRGSPLEGYEDAFSLFGLFALTLAVLRVLTNNLAPRELDLPALVQQAGSVLVALLTGYLLAGFLLCLVQTLPLGERFLGFDANVEATPTIRQVLPPDRVWLALMNHAGRGPFAREGGTTFDPEATFELRYARYRRVKE